MFAFAVVERDTGGWCWAATGSASSRSTSTETPDRLRFASRLPALLAGGGVDTSIDPVALHHYMTLPLASCRRRARSSPASRKLPPATVRIDRARRRRSRDHATGDPQFTRAAAQADWTSAATGRTRCSTALRVAVERRMVADVPVGVLLSGGIDSSLVVALLAEEGQTGLKTFSIGFERPAGESRRRVRVLRPGRRSGSAPTTSGSSSTLDRLLPAIDAAVAAMSEPMVSHDCVAFYLLCRGGLQARQGRAVRPGRRRGARAATTGTRRWPTCRGRDAVEAYARVFFDRRRPDAGATSSSPSGCLPDDPSRAFVTEHFGRAGRRRPRWTPRCASTPRSCSSTTRSSGSTT